MKSAAPTWGGSYRTQGHKPRFLPGCRESCGYPRKSPAPPPPHRHPRQGHLSEKACRRGGGEAATAFAQADSPRLGAAWCTLGHTALFNPRSPQQRSGETKAGDTKVAPLKGWKWGAATRSCLQTALIRQRRGPRQLGLSPGHGTNSLSDLSQPLPRSVPVCFSGN